jgi:5'/3'-nucleotidase
MPLKFLLTNDDGIEAPGLAALDRALDSLGQRLVVAPDKHLSGCSHQATTDRGLHLRLSRGEWHALDGTPVDCTRIGLAHLAQDVDWVLSGINEGGNLGADVYLSGTVAAAREAALLGKPAVAVSQYRRRRETVDWERASRWTRRVVSLLLSRPRAAGTFWNVNLPDSAAQPDEPEIVFCPMDPHPLPVRYRLEDGRLRYHGVYQDRLRAPGRDVEVCFSGAIAVTELVLPQPE